MHGSLRLGEWRYRTKGIGPIWKLYAVVPFVYWSVYTYHLMSEGPLADFRE